MMEEGVIGMVQVEVMVDDEVMEAVEIREAIWVCVHVYTWVCTPVRACPQHAWLCAHVTNGHHPGGHSSLAETVKPSCGLRS